MYRFGELAARISAAALSGVHSTSLFYSIIYLFSMKCKSFFTFPTIFFSGSTGNPYTYCKIAPMGKQRG